MSSYDDMLMEIKAKSHSPVSLEQIEKLVTDAATVSCQSEILLAHSLIQVLDASAGPFLEVMITIPKMSGHSSEEWKGIRRGILALAEKER